MHAKPRTRLRYLLSCGFFLCSNVGHDVFQLENIPNGKKDYKGHTTGLDPRQRYKNFKHVFALTIKYSIQFPNSFSNLLCSCLVPVTYSIIYMHKRFGKGFLPKYFIQLLVCLLFIFSQRYQASNESLFIKK